MPNHFTIQDILKSPAGHLNAHLQAVPAAAEKKSKYGNKRVEYKSMWFDSKAELNRYKELEVLEMIGEITELKHHVVFQLSTCKYESDFTYYRSGELVVEDKKSKATEKLPMFLLKKKMMSEELGIEVKVV